MLLIKNKLLIVLMLITAITGARADVIDEKAAAAMEKSIEESQPSSSLDQEKPSFKGNTATVTTEVGHGADAYVRGGKYSDTNYGTSEHIYTHPSDLPDYREKDYFRFDLSGLNVDPSKSADAPVFSFTTETKFDKLGYNLYILNDGTPGDSVKGWEETSITYNNAPGNNLETNGFLTGDKNGSMTLIGQYTLSGDIGDTLSLTFDNSYLLKDTNGLVTLALIRTSPGEPSDIASKESKFTPPSLTVALVSEAVPEPAEIISVVAFLAAIAGLYFGKKRKSALQAA
ncbi:MAG: DNRLRE domain-containing protein [Chthoniobacterales bacterium]